MRLQKLLSLQQHDQFNAMILDRSDKIKKGEIESVEREINGKKIIIPKDILDKLDQLDNE